MKLYFANCTDQMQTVNVRLPEKKNYFVQTIDIGRQVIIGATQLGRPDIDTLIEQMGPYGLRSIPDFENAREQGLLVPMIYSVDNPVPFEIMQRAVQHNRGILHTRGRKLREEAAIATSHGMRDMAPAAAETLTMSVQEERPGTLDHHGITINEGVRMGLGIV